MPGLIANLLFTVVFDAVVYTENKSIFRGWIMALNSLVILNFISILLLYKKNGFDFYTTTGYLRNVYFLHYDNGHIVTTFPTLCFNLMLYLRNRKRYHLYIIGLILSGYCITFSVTSILMCTVFFAALLIYKNLPMVRSFLLNKSTFIFNVIVVFVV